MESVRLMSLFRCNAMEEENSSFDKVDRIKYFVTDYFDGIEVEKYSTDEHKTLAECMGIQRSANENKKGISHHRYWLYSKEGREKDIFEDYPELLLLTVIQVFLSPDIYQAKNFDQTGEEISESTLFEKMKTVLLENHYEDVEWEAFRLLTSGSYAVIVRSKTVLSAYKVAMDIREIKIQYLLNDLVEKERVAFHTYSIFGVSDAGIMSPDSGNAPSDIVINWKEYLGQDDQIVLRIRFAQKYYLDGTYIESLNMYGRFLSGRYDYEITLNPEEFMLLYPFIRAYKFNNRNIDHVPALPDSNTKVKMLHNLMKSKNLSYINERIQISIDPIVALTKTIWNVRLKKEYIPLYRYNAEKIQKLYENANSLEKKARYLYKFSRNLQEYMRILVRFTRILHEVNYRRELRISVANLIRQYSAMLNGLEYCLEKVEKDKQELFDIRIKKRSMKLTGESELEDLLVSSIKDSAAVIEEHIGMGMYSLEMFLRYLRNINFQTLQTPNFDLQTNICIEKLLVAYSHFMKRFLTVYDSPYISTKQLYPILIPNIMTQDFYVSVLFDEDMEGIPEEKKGKMAVVHSPSFAYLCETCSLLPAVFHEIAHQFRYESRERRNEVLWDMLTRILVFNVVQILLDEDGMYDLREIQETLSEPIWKIVKEELYTVSTDKVNDFKTVLQEKVTMFCATVMDSRLSLPEASKVYVEKTKSCILSYSEKSLLDALSNLSKEIDKLNVFEEFLVNAKIQDCPITDDKKDEILNLSIYKNDSEKQEIINKLFNRELQTIDYASLWILIESVKQCQENQLIEAMSQYIEAVKKANPLDVYQDMQNEFSAKIDSKRGLKNEDERELIRLSIDEWWKSYYTLFDTCPIVRDEMIQLLKHYQEIQFYYRQVKENSANQRSYREVLYGATIKKICSVAKQTIGECLTELSNTSVRILNPMMPQIPVEEIMYLKKKFQMMSESDMVKEVSKKLKRSRFYDLNELDQFIEARIGLYREITSDLYMCTIMNMDAWGYLSLVSEMFKFTGENLDSQLQRVYAVLQCLFAEVIINDGYEGFRRDIVALAKKNLKLLYDNITSYYQEAFLEKGYDISEEYKDWFTYRVEGKIPDSLLEYKTFLALFPEDITGEPGLYKPNPNKPDEEIPILNSTQRWIIRISKQNLEILLDAVQNTLLNEDYEQRCIWQDITGDEAYYRKKEIIHNLLSETGMGTKEIQILCEDVSSILNHPASFFINKKSLLSEEIKFLLREYEESCREVFDHNMALVTRV